MTAALQTLINHIAQTNINTGQKWQDWDIEPISGGANNLLFHAWDSDHNLAIKFTIRDERKRAKREFLALNALFEAGLEVAPQAIFLDAKSYPQPVIVQSWQTGQVMKQPPQNPAEWDKLIAHFCNIHRLKRNHQIPILDAVLSFKNGEHGKRSVLKMAERVPEHARPEIMQKQMTWFENWSPPAFPQPQLALCHSDPNWRNLIQQNDRLISVDWENSGWGDPAFEVADLMTHPAYESVDQTVWENIIKTYVHHSNDPTSELRIRTYYVQMLMWWVIRSARYLYEIPLGADQRLVKPAKGWDKRARQKVAEYADRMNLAISQL